jgi:hypothetical protein
MSSATTFIEETVGILEGPNEEKFSEEDKEDKKAARVQEEAGAYRAGGVSAFL